jgi:hypothetical protein
MSTKTEQKPEPAVPAAPAPRGLHEVMAAAAVTVAETHKCAVNVREPLENGRIRLDIAIPGAPPEPGLSMGIALDVCSEAGGTHTPSSLAAGYDGVTVWLRPVKQEA